VVRADHDVELSGAIGVFAALHDMVADNGGSPPACVA
jgi:hypothetical protein